MPGCRSAHSKVVVLTESNEGKLPERRHVQGLEELQPSLTAISYYSHYLSLVGGTIAVQTECTGVWSLFILDGKCQTGTHRDLTTITDQPAGIAPVLPQFRCHRRIWPPRGTCASIHPDDDSLQRI